MTAIDTCDVCIIGSGAGGASVAHRLAQSGTKIVILEKGVWRSPVGLGAPSHDNDERFHYKARRSPAAGDFDISFARLNDELHSVKEEERSRVPHRPSKLGQGFDLVGGLTPPYAASAWRFYEADFKKRSLYEERFRTLAPNDAEVVLQDWPEGYYEEMADYYLEAERVVGTSGDTLSPADEVLYATESGGKTRPFLKDTEQTSPYPHHRKGYQPPLPYHAVNEMLFDGAANLGWHPFHSPMAINSVPYKYGPHASNDPLVSNRPCISCNYCSGFNCVHGAKNGVDSALLAPLRSNPNVSVVTRATVRRIGGRFTPAGFQCTHVVYSDSQGVMHALGCRIVVVAAGAILSPRLLWNSEIISAKTHPVGGRFLTFHVDHKQEVRFKRPPKGDHFGFDMVKKIAIMDFYSPDAPAKDAKRPQINHISIQTGSKPHPMMIANKRVPLPQLGEAPRNWGGEYLHEFADEFDRLFEIQVMMEDLPLLRNKVELAPELGPDAHGDPRVKVTHEYHPMDLEAANFGIDRIRQLLKEVAKVVEGCGAEAIGTKPLTLKDLRPSGSHVMGTLRMGRNSKEGVVDRDCRVFDTDNVFVADSSFFPTSAGVNPGLTVEANAFRIADVIKAKFL